MNIDSLRIYDTPEEIEQARQRMERIVEARDRDILVALKKQLEQLQPRDKTADG